MRREGGARGGRRRAALRCGRRGLAGHHGEADPGGAELRGPGECGMRAGRPPPPPGPRLGCGRPGCLRPAGARRAAVQGQRGSWNSTPEFQVQLCSAAAQGFPTASQVARFTDRSPH